MAPERIMRATRDAILLHPIGTFSDVTGNRRRIREKIFADMFNVNMSADAAGEQEPDQVVVLRRPTRSFRDSTPSRRKARDKIFAAMLKRNSSGGTGGERTSDTVALQLPIGFFGDSFLHCGEIFAFVFKRAPKD